jgi:hypothetical protein
MAALRSPRHWPRCVVYLGYALIFGAAIVLIAVEPAARQTVQNVAGGVGVAALLGALFTLVRDSTAHERAVWLKRDEQQFNLGVTSHMANVVFDKHVVFCEAYIRIVHEAVDALLRSGPSKDALGWATKLNDLRRAHTPWVPVQVTKELEYFEYELRRMGADNYIANMPGVRGTKSGIDANNAMHERFLRLLLDVIEGSDTEKKGKSAVDVIQLVGEVLDIERLVELRGELVRRAHRGLLKEAGDGGQST